MDDERIEELARSVRSNGIIQPIVVRRAGADYEIIAGERRWRAAQLVGLFKVPVVVRDVPDDRLLAFALIENIQREDLNPIEEAIAYRRLADEFQLTQEQIAEAVGKDRRRSRTLCGCCGCRRKCARTSPPTPCPWDTPARCWRSPMKPPNSASPATSSRESLGPRNGSAGEEGAARRTRKKRREEYRCPYARAPKTSCGSLSVRASGSTAKERAAGSRSISFTKTSCSGFTSCSQRGRRLRAESGGCGLAAASPSPMTRPPAPCPETEVMRRLTDYSRCAG